MDNYIYIVAGLPDLAISFGSSQFAYDDVQGAVVELLSEQDRRLVELFEEGFDEARLTADFYERTAQCRNRFISRYFDFDARLRNLKAEFVAQQMNADASKYTVQLPDNEFEDERRVQEILANSDFLQREQQLDMLKWQKADDLALMDYFNLNTVLAFLAKAHIVSRWARLDRQAGEAMFRQLLGEVRGTFKGISA